MIKILLNTTPDVLNRYTKITGVEFAPFSSNTTEAVAVIIEGSGYKENLQEALKLEVPSLVVAGLIDSLNKDLAVELGYPEEGIIIKDGDNIRNMAGHEFTKDKGIKTQMLVQMCNYAYSKNLVPSVYIWLDKTLPDPSCMREDKKQEPIHQSDGKADSQRQPRAQEQSHAKTARIASKNLTDIFNNHDQIISVFKTISNSQSSDTANILARKTGALHLEITSEPHSYIKYGEDVNKAILNGRYSYSKDGSTAEISSAYNGDILLVEVDLAHLNPELINVLYEKSNQIIHVPGDFENSAEALKMWVESGYKLDKIVAITDENKYRSVYGDLVKTLAQV